MKLLFARVLIVYLFSHSSNGDVCMLKLFLKAGVDIGFEFVECLYRIIGTGRIGF